MTQQEIMLSKKVQEQQQEMELMRQLASVSGFIQAYWNMLKESRTNVEAFNSVNDQYFGLFGDYKYNDWNSFRRALNYHKQKKNL